MRLVAPPVVARDLVDELDFEEVLSDSDRLTALIAEGERLLPDFRALLQDVFSALVKLNVELAAAAALPASARLRLALMRELTGSEGFADTRRVTALRPAAAGFALLRIGRGLLEALKSGRLLSREELGQLWRLAVSDGEREEVVEALASADTLSAAREDAREEIERAKAQLETRRDAIDGEAEGLADGLDDAISGVPREVWTQLVDRAANAGEALAELEGEAGAGQGSAAGDPGAGGGGGGVDALALQAELVSLPGVKRLLRLLGALREEARAAQRKRVPRARTEVFGVERGDDLARLLPAELAGLRHPVLRLDFRRRFLERGLLGYRVRGDERLGRGPAIFLLDVSGSMAGKKVVWAKAIVLTLADLARRERRRVTVICFSSGSRRRRMDLALPKRGRPAVSLDPSELVALSQLGTGGGTDFEGPLRDAMAIIEAERVFERADVVIVTDGEANLSPGALEQIRAFRDDRETRFMGILIDVADHQRASLDAFCDPVVSVSDLSLADARKVFGAF